MQGLHGLWPLPGMPPNGAVHGHGLDAQMRLSLWLAAGLFVLAHFVLLAMLLWRRRKTSLQKNNWLWEAVPLVLLTAVWFWCGLRAERLWAAARYTGASLTAMQVEAVGVQFQWYFRYPGADAAFGVTSPALVDAAAGNPLGLDVRDAAGRDDFITSELVLPVGREVDLRLRSLDVIHGLFVPGMRIKQNAVPGEAVHLHFTPERVGVYPVLCSQVCGSGHSRMQAALRVVTAEEFADWVRLHARK
jgi:cytochrome c oxidase subunit 2